MRFGPKVVAAFTIASLVIHGIAIPVGLYFAYTFLSDHPVLTIIALLGVVSATLEFLRMSVSLKTLKRS